MDHELNQEVEIDLIGLLKVLLRKWWLIGTITALGLFISGAYAYLVLDDVYTAETSMIVQVIESTDSSSTNLLTGQRLGATYTQIAVSNRVLNEVVDTLNLDYTNSQLENMITVTSVSDTLIVRLTVSGPNPEEITSIANEVVTTVKEVADEFEGLEDVEVLDVAEAPINPSGPNRMLYLVVGVLLGGMIGVGIVLAIEYLDKDIKKGKDVEHYLGLRVLGTIPEYDMDEEVA